MRIGIEVQRIFRAKKYGIDRVCVELIKNLQQIDRENQYFIFTRSGPDSSVIQETANFKIIVLPNVSYPIWEQYLLPKAVKKYDCDILHATSNTAPLFLNIPVLLTLHDIIFLEHRLSDFVFSKATYYQKLGNMYRRFIVPLIVRKSKIIITVSEYEKTKILDYFNFLKPRSITIAHNGVSNHFKPIKTKVTLQKIKLKYKLPDHFFLFIGGKDPRKNTKNTLIAFAKFIHKNASNIKLVVMHHNPKELSEILKQIKQPNLIHHIQSIGYVNEKDLPGIYSLSTLFLYPSKREGFGIPIIEAMACGTAVITSNSSSMPEIAESAAHLVDPENPAEIALAIEKIYRNNTYKQELIKKGSKRALCFNWKNMATITLKSYTRLNMQLNS